MEATPGPSVRSLFPDPEVRLDAAGDLWIEDVRAADVAARFGTPLYVTSEARLRANFRRLHAAFASRYPEVMILFANKANGNRAVRRILTQEGAGGDCFGLGELQVSLDAGTPAERLVLNGSNKREDELRAAIGLGVTINLDHPDELETVRRIADATGVRATVNIRIIPFSYADPASLDSDDAAIAADRSHDKWGMDPPTARTCAELALAAPHISLAGVHMHVSRLRPTTEPFALAMELLVTCIADLHARTGWTPRVVDVGGGYAQPRDPESGRPAGDHAVATPESYAEAIATHLLQGCRRHGIRPPALWLEPGRSLVGDTTVLLTTVGAVKRLPTAETTWVNVDASTNHVMRIPLQGYRHEIVAAERADRADVTIANVTGPSCTLDLLAEGRRMPRVSPGEVLAVLDVGGYAEVLATRFNLIPRPATVLVCGDQVDVISRRETIGEMLAGQQVPRRLQA